MSSCAISIASRIASPPPTAPGADSGASPPILIGQLAAKAEVAPKTDKLVSNSTEINDLVLLMVLHMLEE